ncbi:MAG: hypothetical protein ACSLFI_08685 [Solirubrobacterales bacterium]
MKRPLTVLLALVAGLMLSAGLTATAGAKGLNLKVSPTKNLKVGMRVCLNGKVTNRSGNPVSGALFDLEGKTAKTNRKGHFRRCTTFHWSGVHTAFAFKGKRNGRKKLRVRTNGTSTDENWQRVEIQLPAYPAQAGSCPPDRFHQSAADFGIGDASCIGNANPGTDGVFSGQRTRFFWNDGDPRITLVAHRETSTELLRGWIADPTARTWFVNSGFMTDGRQITAGSDVSKIGQPGGPFLLKTSAHTDLLFNRDGWTIHAIGYYYEL